jgi:ubiquinone/menaquinone biosynthesis C-methylase UbiE
VVLVEEVGSVTRTLFTDLSRIRGKEQMMKTERRPSDEEARRYFEFLANMGLTKHIGSMKATRELTELCRIGHSKVILDVGCGVGATPCHLARAYDCRVIGVDLLERMIEQSRKRASLEEVEDRVEFIVADARTLPFEDDLFDAVIIESVSVFFDDKRQAVREYVRVTKPGGHVGMTEMTWLNPPSPETREYYLRTVFADALDVGGWGRLLEDAGLRDVVANAYEVDIPTEARGRFERYGCRGIAGVLLRTLTVSLREASSREFLRDVTSSLPKDMLGDMGYGVYAGRKE